MGLENPNSPIQLKEWLAGHGAPLQSLTKAEVATALDTATGDVNAAAIETVATRQPTKVGPLTLSVESGIMFIALPSGRRLAYAKPRLGENRFGGTSILYEGRTTGRKWGVLETYGGKLAENIVQATARDLLTHGMHQVTDAEHRIVMHVDDEIVVETTTATVEEICSLMATTPDWAEGFPLSADGYACDFYMKG